MDGYQQIRESTNHFIVTVDTELRLALQSTDIFIWNFRPSLKIFRKVTSRKKTMEFPRGLDWLTKFENSKCIDRLLTELQLYTEPAAS